MTDEQQVLYRKYRPQTFSEVLGQEHIVKVLQGSISNDRIGHAYLFSGPRGTGKTTMARIFANALECDPTDIIEIDAASNRGIDDIRQLRDGVHSLPFNSSYKMYIIDEVHMLTKEAFNALLKTLEEPPAHVIFVLATTELHKVLPTVISRCQSFRFKSPNRTILKDMVSAIAKQEGLTIEPSALEIIAMLGNGSFRDTQGVLQKISSYSKDSTITREEVQEVTGVPRTELIHRILKAINEKDSEAMVSSLSQAQEDTIDADILLQLIIEAIRDILFIRFSEAKRKELEQERDTEEYSFLHELASSKNNIHSELLSILLDAYRRMSTSYQAYLPLEIALMKVVEEKS
jgi:DNA polymerase-3 subunit gamma/tau